jgi:hypothetical protein
LKQRRRVLAQVVGRQGRYWGLKMKKIEITPDDFDNECGKIIAMGFPVADTLVMLSDFKAGVKIISPVIKTKKRKGK